MYLDSQLVTSLARVFGTRPVAQAAALVGQNAVEIDTVTPVGELVEVAARVRDGAAVTVHLTYYADDGELLSVSCGRDGDRGCPHVLAALLSLGSPATEAPPPAPPWQRALDAIVPSTADVAPASEVALFVSVIDPASARDRWAYGRRREPFLGIRPATRGQRGSWIKGQAGWDRLGALDLDPSVAELLVELRARHGIQSGTDYYYSPEWLPLDGFAARGLMPLLTELRDAGVALVSPGREQRPVSFGAEPARPRIAVEHHRRRLRVRGELLIAGVQVNARAVHAVGEPVVAIAQVSDPGQANEHVFLHPLAEPMTDAMWRLLRHRDQVSVDAQGREAFEKDYLPRLRALAPIESPDGSYEVPAPPEVTLELVVSHVERQVHLTWSWSGYAPGAPRDRAHEQEILTRLRDAVGEHASLVYGAAPDGVAGQPPDRVLGGTSAVIFVGEVLPSLRDLPGVSVLQDDAVPSYRSTTSGPVVSIAAEPDGTDWFDLHVQVEVDGEQVEFAELFVALAAGDPIFLLPDGRYFSLAGPEFDQLRAIIDEARTLSERPLDRLRMSRYQVDLWQELVELGIVAAQEQAWLASARGLADTAMLEQVAVPDGIDAELRGYQQTGLSWLHFLRSNGLGGILGDDMGLGKTLQAIAMMELAREADPELAPFLVVAPTSVVGNWAQECRRFAPGLRVVMVGATERRRGMPLADVAADADVVVTSYALFRLEDESYRELPWSGLILDEAQMVKNHRSQGYRSARMLEAPFKLAITGTPLENNLMELWALTALVCPGLLGGESHFTEFYRGPIEKDRDGDRLSRLQRRLRPFLLRRRKEDVAAELPPKQEQMLELELHPKHRRLYELRLQRERQKVLGLLDDIEANRFQVFRSLTLLRQLALDAALVEGADADGTGDGATPPSAKAETLIEMLTAAAADGHRVLVFSQFTRFLGKARDLATAAGIPSAYLDGSTRRRDREIERFRSGEVPVFFVSLKAGGFGLNLTEADHVILLDPWWNPATEAQAIDRTHRIGQTKSVMVYRLVSAGTIEAKVLALSARKAKLFTDVLDGDGAASAGMLTADEIRSLVS